MEQIKSQLYALCQQFIKQRIETAETALEQAREASNDDTKSSAGDKFETTREMMQQDISRNKRLLMDAKENLHVLEGLKSFQPFDRIKSGHLVITSEEAFYISISAGQLTVDQKSYFAISAQSPIGRLLLGKAVNDTVTFNQKQYRILELF
ncbi:3-oxoacyl-ACP synthase [Pedobacter sp.]|uniref:3-oxoacyl-ACP synthase n=1 Tax=Pedobacter sp. TaxID=1411316 RepID=UPI003D7F7F4D